MIDVSGSFAADCLLIRNALVAVMSRPDINVQFSNGLQVTVVKFRGQPKFVLRPGTNQSKDDIARFFSTFTCEMSSQ